MFSMLLTCNRVPLLSRYASRSVLALQRDMQVVGEAADGKEALQKASELVPDVVLMDIVMPDMGGIDAVREITKFDPNAKVLMCSAMGQQALVVEAIQAGVNNYVVKPFTAETMQEKINKIFNK